MANYEWQKIATKEYINGAFFDFNFEHESENGLIKIQMIDKLGNVIEKTITINADKYINSVVYEGESKQFRFTFTDGTSIVCPFSVDLSDYPTNLQVDKKINEAIGKVIEEEF